MKDQPSLFDATVTFQIFLQPLQHLLAIKRRGISNWKIQRRASTNINIHKHTLSLDLLFIQFTCIVQVVIGWDYRVEGLTLPGLVEGAN